VLDNFIGKQKQPPILPFIESNANALSNQIKYDVDPEENDATFKEGGIL